MFSDRDEAIKGGSRLAISHAEARELLSVLIPEGHATLEADERVAHEKWCEETGTTLSRVFGNRKIVKRFKVTGSAPLGFSGASVPGQLECPELLVQRSPRFRAVRKALR